MSVGGKVTEVIVLDDVVYIDTIDHKEECAIYVKRNQDSEAIMPGDVVWWQGRIAYWTTADRTSVVEKPLTRHGFSGVTRPNII